MGFPAKMLRTATIVATLFVSVSLQQCDDSLTGFMSGPEFQAEKGKLLKELPFLGKEFSVSFELFIANIPTAPYVSVLHVTKEADKGMGMRVPGIWIMPNSEMHLAHGFNGNANNFKNHAVTANSWMKVEITQKLVDEKFMFDFQRGSTPSGSEVPFWPLSPPSSRCGSPSRSTMNVVLLSYTGSVSKHYANKFIHSAKISSLYFCCIFNDIEYRFT